MTLFESIGETAGCLELARSFYARVKGDPVLRPFFPGKSLRCATEEFAAFLVQFLGGPDDDTQRRWWISLHESHKRFAIGETERRAWLANMDSTLDSSTVPEPVRSTLRDFFRHSSAYVTNAEEGKAKPLTGELAVRWDRQQLMDDAVAAIRRGDAPTAIALAEKCRDHSRSAFIGILGQMLRVAPDYVHGMVRADRSLILGRFNGRTLLHLAAALGDLDTVELLLELRTDPNVTDGGRHTPLYSLANQCQQGGGDVVHALVRGGADVNACAGVKHCTPLHMAARRGSVEIAMALLACGADPNALDSNGVTPYQRALNCRKHDCAAVLRR